MTLVNHALRFSSGDHGRRTFTDLCIAFCVAFGLLVVNILLNLNESVQRFFEDYSKLDVTRLLVNGLFVWLVVLLWISFRRWINSVRCREELEDILSSISPDALVVVSAARRITLCNSSVERIFGYPPEEVINQTTDLLYFDRRANRTQPHEIYEALEKDGFHIGTATGKRKGGGGVPLEIISAELSGEEGGAVLLMRDISERLRREEERCRLDLRAQQAKKLESLGVLAGGIAHNFNTLLMVIQGHTDLTLMNLPEDAPIRESIMQIENATARAVKLCSHMLSYSGKASLDVCTFDLSEIVRETGRLLSVSIGRKAVVQYALAENLPPVDGDVVQMHQVAMNLIHNAVESLGGKAGEVKVSTGCRECDADFLSDLCTADPIAPGRYVYLEVADTGCGISGETKNRICDPFFTTKPTGHGLGLAAVVGIIRGHHGGMRVDSKVGEGTRFTVLMPLSSRVHGPVGAGP